MLNFNGNNIGVTKFCQENLKKKLWPFALVPIAWCLRGEVLFQIHVVLSRFHAKVVFFLFVGGHTPQTPRLTSNPYIYQDILNHSFTKQKF
jgi:hypothetical protein